MKKIGIVAKKNKPEAIDTVRGLIPFLKDRGIETILDNETASLTGESSSFNIEDVPKSSDLIIVLGGDGTLLYAARLVGKSEIPILGVNLGSLGFLTEIALEELNETIEKVISGDFRIEERMMLKAEIPTADGKKSEYSVLNDVVINKGVLARIINLEVMVNGAYLTTYNADGLIVSTPTGSTGYSLSAGGPVVHPTLSAIIINPICPHTLTNRPILVPEESKIEIRLLSGDGTVYVTLDGQVGVDFPEGRTITVSKSKRKVRLIEPPERDYYDVLRTKLRWGGVR
ncbi:MAG: NAD(+)/NADH kinase [Deltaproteobacteria bacterium]|uniref:NAD kinase n=1 Tax=Candidatus Zymogenus saltonus TaxID=2844893 RepID=A0A9D8KF92_9DELT|nr:NAD(+)/NADH kinase [Candidatus Zymogenus saltonus]